MSRWEIEVESDPYQVGVALAILLALGALSAGVVLWVLVRIADVALDGPPLPVPVDAGPRDTDRGQPGRSDDAAEPVRFAGRAQQ